MKAHVLFGVGDLRYMDVKKPLPRKGEVLVAVKAVGVCGSDIPRIYETGAHRHPLIPGHEFSGIVTEAADPEGERWVGKSVGVFPLIPCHKCEACSSGRYEMCADYDYIGSRRDGAFAEYVAVPVKNLIELPPNVSYGAAAMLEPLAVTIHAMRRARVDSNDTVAVCGLGTIGSLLSMVLADRGVKSLFLIGNKDIQRKNVEGMGAFAKFVKFARFIDARREDASKAIMDATGGRGVDVFFECVGKNETFAQALESVSGLGRVLLVGNPYSDMGLSKDVYWRILRKQLFLTGTWNSSFTHDTDDDWHYALERMEKGRIEPEKLISHPLTLDSLPDGLDLMHSKTGEYCKVMAFC